MSKRRKKGFSGCPGLGPNSGYGEYRYGPKKAKPIALAPIFAGERRKDVLERVEGVLGDWRLSPFENEAACVHGLRQGLCESGHGWARSQAEALILVGQGLDRLGAERPSWEQGQREYVEPAENCRWCARPLDEGRMKSRFCAPHCAKMFIERRSFECRAIDDKTRRAAYKVAGRAKMEPRDCLQCKEAFQPEQSNPSGRFCCNECRTIYRASDEARKFDQTCGCCGKAFRSVKEKVTACSQACASRLRRRCDGQIKQPTVRPCTWCKTPFLAKLDQAQFCSASCRAYDLGMRKGKPHFKIINVQVFDFLFARSV